MGHRKVISLLVAFALLVGMVPVLAAPAKAASTKEYQANNTEETVLTVYQVRTDNVDNQNGYSTLQSGKAMAQDGFLDKNKALSVTWLVQADEAGSYTFDPYYYIGNFGALKNGVYNMVWCVNDTHYYLGADITGDTVGTHKVVYGMDPVELPLEKGVNIVRMLPIAGPHYEYQKVDRGDGNVTAAYVNIYKVGIDSRLTVRKNEPLKISMETADRNADQFIMNQFSLSSTDYGFAQVGKTYVNNNYTQLPNFDTLNQSNLASMPYVSYTLNAPEDGWYDMTMKLSVATFSRYGNDGYLIVRVNGQNYKRWIRAQNTTNPHDTTATWPFSDQNISVPLKKGDNTVTVTCAMGMKGGTNADSYEKASGGYCAYTRISSLTVYGGVKLSNQKIDPTTVADVSPKSTTLQAETYGIGWKYAASGTVMKSEDLSAAANLPSMASLWQGEWFDRAAVPSVSFTVDAPAAGLYTVKAVYDLTPAEGTDALDYAITASVNDSYYDKARFEPQTALSRSAGYSELVLELDKGVNVIRILPVLDGMPAKALDLDHITVTGSSAVSGILPQQLVLKSADAQYRNVLTVSGDVLIGKTGDVLRCADLNVSNLGQTGWFAYTLDVPASGYYDLQVLAGGGTAGAGELAMILDGQVLQAMAVRGRATADNPVNLSCYMTAGTHTVLITGLLGQEGNLGALTVSGGIAKAAEQTDPRTLGIVPLNKEGGLVPGSVYTEHNCVVSGVPANTTLEQFKSNFTGNEQALFTDSNGEPLKNGDIITAGCCATYPNQTVYAVGEVLTQESARSVGADVLLAMCNPVGRLAKYRDAMLMEASASNFTLSGQLEGDVTITVTVESKRMDKTLHSLFVEVDGAVSYYTLDAGQQSVVIAKDLVKGNHTIKVSKGTEAYRQDMYIHSVVYTGKLEASMAASRRIEFLGDSITAGSGVFFEDCGYGETHSYFSYANMTADALGADYYSVANGGWRFTSSYKPESSIATIYDDTSMHEESLGVYDFSWKPDVIVINLGTNDAIGYRSDKEHYSEALFKSNITALLDLVREKNPDAEIVWVYGAMLKECEGWIKTAVEAYGQSDSKVHYLSLDGNSLGRGNHPDFVGSTISAGMLVEGLCKIMGWDVPAGTHATGDCGADCQFCRCNEETLALHKYDDVCDSTCNNANCKHTRVPPHDYVEGSCSKCQAKDPDYKPAIIGDFNDDGFVTDTDVIYLLWYTVFPEDYPLNGKKADFTGDGNVTDADVIYLLWYTVFPEDYPLNP